jgi:hypothetical protein
MRPRTPHYLVRRSEVLAGLSFALDLTEGQRPGHSVRSCLIGMRIAEAMSLSREQRTSLFYALLMKDLGCSSNAARFAALFGSHDQDLKANLKLVNWSRAMESFRFVAKNVSPGQFFLKRTWRLLAVMAKGPAGAREVVQTRCERGADIAQMIGLTVDTAAAIRSLDEHWDGQGQPYSKKGEDIPLLGRILGLSQTAEVFFSTYGALTAYDIAAAAAAAGSTPQSWTRSSRSETTAISGRTFQATRISRSSWTPTPIRSSSATRTSTGMPPRSRG